ncbi:hypothetical protein Ddye_001472 [Dipteronia dyeriana]|uniref:RNase H type-1 domain-containing protein n=1 Tax=Dipteronia dyeriana TaxID=168575 RepID=A0AAD9XP88_9ROSI|nr:hypothetical protein Ddye_001472 [Dipteronia dyeriana]
MFNVNTDVDVSLSGQRVGFEIVIRITKGLVMSSSAQYLQAPISSHIAEALVVLHGIRFALNSGLLPFLVESDALNVVNLIRFGCSPDVDVGIVVRKILEVRNAFLDPLIFFASRKSNLVAHSLAKMVLSIEEDLFWLMSIPPYLELLVMGDALRSTWAIWEIQQKLLEAFLE